MASFSVKILLRLVMIVMTGNVITATGNELLTTEQHQIALCVQTIAQQYFISARSILVSMPRDSPDNTGRPLIHFPHRDNLHLVDLVLQNLNGLTCCPLQLFPADTTLHAVSEINYCYIIFVWPQEPGGDIMDSLRSQMDMMRDSEIQQWNPRGRFVVVVTDLDSESPPSMALQIYEAMWMEYSVTDNVILMSDRSKKKALDLYSGFPYETGNCENIKEVSLMDQWVFEDNGTFRNKQNLFPHKLQKDLHNCVIRVATLGFHPFVTLLANYTTADGTAVYDVRGFSVEFIRLSMDKMNAIALFLKPSLDISFEASYREVSNLMSRQSDILVGTLPLMPVVITSFSEPSIPFIYDAVKWFIPCPKPIPRVHKIMTMYNASVWLTMIIVFIVSGVVLWCSTKRPYRLEIMESYALRTISNCIYSSWAIFIGISVPEMPKAWRLRMFFILYVWYSFAMTTVFQAFFVSYLVEPGYEKMLETMEELLDSDVLYGYNVAMEFGMATTEYTDHLKFPDSRRIDCGDTRMCIRRIMTDGDVAIIIAPMYVQYVTNEVGLQGQTKHACALSENLMDGTIVALMPKGSPLLNQLNKYIRRCLEGGLVERYWTELNLEAILKSKEKFVKDGSGMYFVFSLSHTAPAFSVLGFGYVCSCLMCLAECLHKRVRKNRHHSGQQGNENERGQFGPVHTECRRRVSTTTQTTLKLRGLSPRGNYTDRATAACRRR
jgi:hypothetical protein